MLKRILFRDFLFLFAFLFEVLMIFSLISCKSINKQTTVVKHIIIFIHTDDPGYGDVRGYGPTGVQAFNVDLLAKNCIQFTDAYSGASTLYPERTKK